MLMLGAGEFCCLRVPSCLPARYYKLACFLLVSFFLVSVVSRVFFGVIVDSKVDVEMDGEISPN